MNKRHPSRLRYSLAVALAACGALVRFGLLHNLGYRNVYLTFFPAVMLAALYGGFAAGLLCAALSAGLVDYFLIEPVHSFTIREPADWVSMVIFLVSCTMVSWIAESRHRAQNRARQAEIEAGVEAARLREAEAKALLGAIVTSSSDAILSKDLSGTVQSWNAAAARMFGYRTEEIVGNPATVLIPPESLKEEEEILQCIEQGERINNYDTVRVAKDGRRIEVSVTASPIRDSAGEIIGASTIIHDITVRKQAEAALRLSEEKFSVAFGQNPAAIAITCLEDGKFLDVNDTWLELQGYQRDEVIGRFATQLPIWPTPEARNRFVETLKKKGSLRGWVEEFTSKSGKAFVAQLSAQVLSVRDEKLVLTTLVDITDLKRAEESLRESQKQNEFLATLIRASSQPVGIGYPDGRLGLVNRAFEELTGYTGEELRCIDWAIAMTPPEWRKMEEDKLAELHRTGRPVRYEKEYIRKDGKRVPVELLVHLVRDSQGKPQYYYSFLTNITERKQKEGELRQLNRTLKALSDSNQAIMHARDEAQYLDEVCQNIVRDCGHAMVWIGFAEADEARSVRVAAHAGFEQGYLQTLRLTWADTERGRGPTGAAIRAGKPCVCKNMRTDPAFAPWREEALKHGYASSVALPLLADGKAFGAVTIYSRLPDPFSGDEVKLLSELADGLVQGLTTLRLRAEGERAGEQLRLQWSVLQSAANGLVITGRDGSIQWVNEAFTRLTGYSAGEAIGQNPRVLNSGRQDNAFFKEMWTTIMAGCVWHGELVNKRKDGSFYPEEMTITPVTDSSGAIAHFVAVKQDISARKRAEEALRRSNARLDLLAGTASELLRSDSPQMVMHSLCQRVLSFLDCQVFVNFLVDEDERRLHLNACGGLSDEQMRQMEWLDFGVAVCGCAARDGCSIVAQNIAATPDPRTEMVKSFGLQAYACHPFMIQGRVIGTLSFGARHRARFTEDEVSLMKAVADQVAIAMERQRAQAKLLRLARDLITSNEELQQFAYVASHDLQEPLRAVAGYLSLIEERFADKLDDKGRYHIAGAIQGAERMHTLINDLLELSRVGTRGKEFESTNLHGVLDAALHNLSARIQESGARITSDPLPALNVDASQMTMLFQNLIGNAIKFRSEQTPEIHISVQSRTGQRLFAVRDNGIGIDPQYFDRIFQIFQRLHTRKHYPGTGIGLAICKKIVERHGGKIWVESQPGRGAAFYFTLSDKPIP